jgi:hypothetical protein
MKTYLVLSFLALAVAVAVYLVSSLQNVEKLKIQKENIPQGTYEITKWMSDAQGLAVILDDPAEQTSLKVSQGLGQKAAEGLRPSQDYLNVMPGKNQAHRIINKRSGQAVAYILASERLEIEAGFNILKRMVVLSIRDPGDSHHRNSREGP